MNARPLRHVLILLLCLSLQVARGQPPSGATVLAWVGEVAVYESEIELVRLRRGLTPDALQNNKTLRTALANSVVRRRLAYTVLLEQSGKLGASIVDQASESLTQQLLTTGRIQAPEEITAGSDVGALQIETQWLALWNDYLRVRLTETNLQRFFASRRHLYDGSEVEVSQIFFSDVGRSDRLQKIADQIRSGAVAFADAAREHSEAGSASDGGKVGWIGTAGDLPSVVADQALASNAGALLPVIRSGFGLHLVYVHQKRSGTIGFTDLKDQRRLRRDAANFLFDDLVDKGTAKHVVRWSSTGLDRSSPQ